MLVLVRCSSRTVVPVEETLQTLEETLQKRHFLDVLAEMNHQRTSLQVYRRNNKYATNPIGQSVATCKDVVSLCEQQCPAGHSSHSSCPLLLAHVPSLHSVPARGKGVPQQCYNGVIVVLQVCDKCYNGLKFVYLWQIPQHRTLPEDRVLDRSEWNPARSSIQQDRVHSGLSDPLWRSRNLEYRCKIMLVVTVRLLKLAELCKQ